MNWSLLVVLLMLVAAGAPARCRAATGWQPATGPLGGYVHALAIDPLDADSVYAAAGTALWHSQDGGKTWRCVEGLPSDAMRHSFVGSIAISRDENGPIILAPAPIISSDRGKTWKQERPAGLPVRADIHVGPAGSGVCYAASDTAIMRSDDRGQTWKALGGWPDEVQGIEHFIADRFDADTISFMYRVEDKTSLVLSRDGGKSFRNVPFPEGEDFAASVSTDPDDKTIIHLCTQRNGWGRGHERRYFYSYDDGASWELLWDPAAERDLDPATRGKLRRVFPDVIPTPVPVWGGTPLNRQELAWSEDTPGRVVAAFDGWVFRSDDFGESWEPSMEGLVATSIQRFALDPRDAAAAYCADDNHLWHTADRGKTWTRMPPGDNYGIVGITFSPDAKHVFVLSGGIWRATSERRDWEQVWEAGDYRSRPFALFFAEEGEAGDAGHVCVALGNGFRLESRDDGKTWTNAGENDLDLGAPWSPRGFAQRRLGETDVWYMSDTDHALLVSTDHGRIWTPRTVEGTSYYPAWSVAADGTAWIAADGGLSILAPLAEPPPPGTGKGLPGLAAIASDPSDGEIAYMARSDDRILRTTDGGKTFEVLDGGPVGCRIDELAVSPRDGALWVAAAGNGVSILDKPKAQPGKPLSE